MATEHNEGCYTQNPGKCVCGLGMTDHVTPEDWRSGLSASTNPGRLAPDHVTPEEARDWARLQYSPKTKEMLRSLASQVEELTEQRKIDREEFQLACEQIDKGKAQVEQMRAALTKQRNLAFSAFNQAYPIEGPNKLREQFRALAHHADKALAALDASHPPKGGSTTVPPL